MDSPKDWDMQSETWLKAREKTKDYFLNRELQLIRPFIRIDDKVLELMCGNGIFSNDIDSEFIVGIDWSTKMLENRKKGPIYVKGDACTLPFADKSFDKIVWMGNTVPCIPPKTFVRSLREASRVLKPQGLLFMNFVWLGAFNWKIYYLWKNHLWRLLHKKDPKGHWKTKAQEYYTPYFMTEIKQKATKFDFSTKRISKVNELLACVKLKKK